jgi:hypothetical protein
MPVRVVIHSSDVSTRRSKSWFVTRFSGSALPVPEIIVYTLHASDAPCGGEIIGTVGTVGIIATVGIVGIVATVGTVGNIL